MNALTYLTSEAFSNIPSDLVSDLQRMLSMDAVSRPSAMAFTGVFRFLFLIYGHIDGVFVSSTGGANHNNHFIVS
jgi:hypothetical protein